jgi:hypothetical protein
LLSAVGFRLSLFFSIAAVSVAVTVSVVLVRFAFFLIGVVQNGSDDFRVDKLERLNCFVQVGISGYPASDDKYYAIGKLCERSASETILIGGVSIMI